MSDPNLDELAAELAEFAEPEKKGGRPPREERIIAGFEEIQRFVEKHGRTPQHGEGRDIFERLYAVRLDRLRALEECRTLLAPLDHQGLLSGAKIAVAPHGGYRRGRAYGRTRGRSGRQRHHRIASRPRKRLKSAPPRKSPIVPSARTSIRSNRSSSVYRES